MKLIFVEVTNGQHNWGKFMVARFDTEWQVRSTLYETFDGSVVPLLRSQGWCPQHTIVFDLATGEGAMFLPGPHGYAQADLEKHKVWVCPMFEPFLTWLYKQDLSDLHKLPAHVVLPDAPFAMSGYRRTGLPETPAKGLKK